MGRGEGACPSSCSVRPSTICCSPKPHCLAHLSYLSDLGLSKAQQPFALSQRRAFPPFPTSSMIYSIRKSGTTEPHLHGEGNRAEVGLHHHNSVTSQHRFVSYPSPGPFPSPLKLRLHQLAHYMECPKGTISPLHLTVALLQAAMTFPELGKQSSSDLGQEGIRGPTCLPHVRHL